MWQAALKRFGRRSLHSPKLVDTSRRPIAEKDLREGNEIEGFIVNRVAFVPEFSLTLIKLRHMRTGCEYLHMARDDSNNTFCVGFRTTPTDSTGLPHILEHTTLCGSRNYPCRDPFMKMLNRSMATFMNAMTGPDYTIYPFATQNKTDFRNLMSVYLDAVFQPELRESDFKQEGWRLEHELLYDKESPITIKGVVFNEMKGVYGENQTLFNEALMNNMLPSNTYRVSFGGDPKYIPTLTYSDLKAFHKKFYHPSNCRIFSYGNFPLQDHLVFINKAYLADYPDTNDFSKSTLVPSEDRWDSERRKEITCRFDPLAPDKKKQSSIAISVLCNDIKNIQETFVFQILSELLVRGPNSAFYKSLVEPNIGGGFSPVTGYESHTRDTMFSVGLMAVDPIDFERIVNIYHKTIDNVINEGFDDNQIKAILHNIEINTKHQTADFGLGILFGTTPVWNHDGDVVRAVKVNDKVMKFKKSLADNPLYLQDMVQEYFKDNTHRLILTMIPDMDFERKEEETINQLLARKIDVLLPHQKENIYEMGLELSKEQENNKKIDCLPTLSISDLNKDIERVNLKGFQVNGLPVQVCSVPTNGLTYIRGIINASILSEEAKSVLPLFCNVITKMGTKSHNYRRLDQLITLKTGGLFFSPHIAESTFETSSFEEGVTFASSCLDKNLKGMTNILAEIFTELTLTDVKRFETLLKTMATEAMTGIGDSGHLYAMSSASALVSTIAQHKERFGGLSYVQTMKQLSQSSEFSETLEMMQGIADIVLNKKIMRISLNVSPESEEKSLSALDEMIGKFPGDHKMPFKLTKKEKPVQKIKGYHYIFPFQVNYAALSIPTVEYAHEDFPVLRVLARLLASKYLLPRIREKGGAYGTGANISTSGIFSFFSFSDPKPINSFDIFNEAQEWVQSGSDYTDQDVEEAKLGVFQSLDAPIPPSAKGSRQFLYGISDDLFQKHREIIMRCNKSDLIRVSKRLNSTCQGRALLGPENRDVLLRTGEQWEVRRVDTSPIRT
ncbi:unnamed protein product [Nezara viridula]|uniref:Presequence protease, mitochondrial n=1 Tax=Nezara viridula TaxID=85310 RepID=A0A9P0HKP2_NEZVI|nr:unnamed protein product [Nezara viridula]